MIGKFFKSRGWGKLRRNRFAMVSLAVIGVYFLLAVWMMAMDVVQWAGKTTGAWELEEVPVMRAFLSERMLEQSGPPSVSGLGKPIGMVGRLDYIDFFFSRARSAVDEVAQMTGDSDRTPRDVLDGYAVQERANTVDVSPIEELRLSRRSGVRIDSGLILTMHDRSSNAAVDCSGTDRGHLRVVEAQ